MNNLTYKDSPWVRSWGYKYQRTEVMREGRPIGYIQTRVVFRRGRMPQRVETHTGLLDVPCCVLGTHVDWLVKEDDARQAGKELPV